MVGGGYTNTRPQANIAWLTQSSDDFRTAAASSRNAIRLCEALITAGFTRLLLSCDDAAGRCGLTRDESPARRLLGACLETGVAPMIDVSAPFDESASVTEWQAHVQDCARHGVAGLRCLHPQRLPADTWAELIGHLHVRFPDFFVAAWMPGLATHEVIKLEAAGFDGRFSSFGWWDGYSRWMFEERERLGQAGAVIAPLEEAGSRTGAVVDPRTLVADTPFIHHAWIAAWTSAAIMVSCERVLKHVDALRRIHEWRASHALCAAQPRMLSGPLSPSRVLFCPQPPQALVLYDGSLDAHEDALALLAERLPGDLTLGSESIRHVVDGPAAVSVVTPVQGAPVQRNVSVPGAPRSRTTSPLRAALLADRIAIENVCPRVDAGQFPVKATTGQTVRIKADVFADGHAKLAASVLWRAADESEWREVPLEPMGNDRWHGQFIPQRMGRHYYTVHAWKADEAHAHRSAQSVVFPLQVERREAEFSSWYELFPRSMGVAGHHGSLRDVIPRLPALRAMGFDVLYFPPIHPIGLSHRKGRNNSLVAGPDDPGSPYAIGNQAGGHTTIHPELGSLDDFLVLQAQAREHGMEIALDFAIQCSPDHPWLSEHPEWFRWREDGTVQYAENPPKRYEDIVNPDFYSQTATAAQREALWCALRDVVLFWAGHGVRIFRVDNPHTKPLPFWEWMIREVQRRYPDALFLSEAFTRPKMMARLAKLGFSQSYTYFTWRNTKEELTDYLVELNNEPLVTFFRPHFFVNTPDINPFFLQHSGRAGFLIRAALATTLSGLWGMYSGFELCEAEALPGREEYLDAEKYEIKSRNWHAPGNIATEISRLNAIRRATPALQTHRGIQFHAASDARVLFFSKSTPQADSIVLVAVSLDPHNPVSVTLAPPAWLWRHARHHRVRLQSLWDERSIYAEAGDLPVSLTPERPFALWSVCP